MMDSVGERKTDLYFVPRTEAKILDVDPATETKEMKKMPS